MTFKQIIDSPSPVLVDFTAAWCGPCKTMAPVLKDVKHEIGDGVKIVKIDTDKNPAISTIYGIQGIPTLILFKQGKILWRQSGAMPKNVLLDAIKSFS